MTAEQYFSAIRLLNFIFQVMPLVIVVSGIGAMIFIFSKTSKTNKGEIK